MMTIEGEEEDKCSLTLLSSQSRQSAAVLSFSLFSPISILILSYHQPTLNFKRDDHDETEARR